MDENAISKIIFVWIFIITSSLFCFSANDTDTTFYKIGPSNQLIVLGFRINTPTKYTIVIFYSLFNNVIRNFNTNILRPWITHNIQDQTMEGIIRKQNLNYYLAYQINTIYTTYTWVDFIIYVHLLLDQIDLFLIEAFSDIIIMTIITHYWYLPLNNRIHYSEI